MPNNLADESEADLGDLTGEDLVQQWESINRIHSYENSCKNLEKLVNVLGYNRDCFGSALDNFLSDNPGAMEAIRNWIGEYVDKAPDWFEAFTDEIATEDDK